MNTAPHTPQVSADEGRLPCSKRPRFDCRIRAQLHRQWENQDGDDMDSWDTHGLAYRCSFCSRLARLYLNRDVGPRCTRCFDSRTLRPSTVGNRGQIQARCAAALDLLRSDIQRMRTNSPTMMAALARVYGVTNSVDREDWGAARDGILELRASYGRR
jgi:hypothetical protein